MSDSNPIFYIFNYNNKFYINFEEIDKLLPFDPEADDEMFKAIKELKHIKKQFQKEKIVFIDSEIDISSEEILDLGACANQNDSYHGADINKFREFVKGYHYVVGHNIVSHDLKYLSSFLDNDFTPIDTLFLSALLFPKRPYHRLVKDDKLRSFEKNNPLHDAEKAMALFYDEVNAFQKLEDDLKRIFYLLLSEKEGYQGFFNYIEYESSGEVAELIKSYFSRQICANSDIEKICLDKPIELAYALAVISTDDESSIIPPWILRNYPETDTIIQKLRNTPCNNCDYCNHQFNVRKKLKELFGYEEFRLFDGKPLQEKAVLAAVRGESLIAVFPTGGGKSLTFQLPALIAGQAEHALTVVISPLQALMKDQVDSLRKHGIIAVAINGLLDPISRKEAIELVQNGTASILYIAPEALRNNTIQTLLKKRIVSRFVIDEAHCFSSWGQDFRVDYLYIGKFIRELEKEKRLSYSIPVSCFTATASKWVLRDIRNYFLNELGLSMQTYVASSERKNLKYEIRAKYGNDKYSEIRTLISANNCPTIVYVFSVKKTHEIAKRLCNDGILARAFNGEMNSKDKQEVQEAFINNEIDVMVATSAFGMGVDKDDVSLVIHYQMPSSIENYLQEAGRAGRKESITGRCIALYDETDIDFLFYFLNQTKLTIDEINNIWSAIKRLSKKHSTITKSGNEIAKEAGWTDNTQRDTEVSVRTAINALENAGYIERLNNVTWVYATGIIPKTMEEAVTIIRHTTLLDDNQKKIARLIVENLIGSRSRAKAGNEDSSKRTDYLADVIGEKHSDVIAVVEILKEIGILADSSDLKAYIDMGDTENKSILRLKRFLKLEDLLLNYLDWEDQIFNYKDYNEYIRFAKVGQVTPAQIKTILYYWTMKGYVSIGGQASASIINIVFRKKKSEVQKDYLLRQDICTFIIEYLFEKYSSESDSEHQFVEFSLLELQKAFSEQPVLHKLTVSIKELQDALMYLQRIDSMDIEGGFFVLYQPYKIKRIENNPRKRYTIEDYHALKTYYQQKMRQIHMIDEYSKLMMEDEKMASKFALDYFELDNDSFDKKYFSKERIKALRNNVSPRKYDELFGHLSKVQKEIINDNESQHILVTAGPGSGKTMVLVHKLASLILLEDVKCEQLLMLTFSRLAATEFKDRLIKLIGKPAYGVEIKTFHSYCFDILGRKGDKSDFNNIVSDAVNAIRNGDVELDRITKAVLVVDEAQDINCDEYELIKVIMDSHPDMRVVMVGDDDQNIFEFRGSSSEYMKSFAEENNATYYHMIDNYRSGESVVCFANKYAQKLVGRLKQEPIRSVSSNEGEVSLTKYASDNLELPLIDKIIDNQTYSDSCVLTWTNEESLRVVTALSEKGINARLIQGDDKVKLNNIAELHRFRDILYEEVITPIIPKDTWMFARDSICEEFRGSSILNTCLTIIDRFETTNDPMYLNDFEEYLLESSFEDFIEDKKNEIVVSTIHKSKGREFNTVYLVLNHCELATEENKRVVYVGLTRAKENLHILYNGNIMDDMYQSCDHIFEDNILYERVSNARLDLTYTDVWLDYFIDYQDDIKNVRSGAELRIDKTTLYAETLKGYVPVAKLSKAGRKKVMQMVGNNENYTINAEARFIVYWRKSDNPQDYLIILPSLYLVSDE